MAVLHVKKRTGDGAPRLLLLVALVGSSAYAGDVGLTVTMSPDAARAIRDWRRANGLPQPPETVEARTSTKEVEVQSKANDRSDMPKANWVVARHAAKP